MMSNKYISMVHTIPYTEAGPDKVLIYLPDRQEIFIANSVTGNAMHDIYNRNISISAVAKALHTTETELASMLNMLEERQVETSALSIAPKRNALEVMIHLANDCNLRCVYCYAAHGTYGQKREMMSPETGKQVVDFLYRNYTNTDFNFLFFGGEPMLNFGTLKAICEHASIKNQQKDRGNISRFRVITNGTILSGEMITVLRDHRVGWTVSIDGPSAVHDFLRPFPGGEGSYETIKTNLYRFREAYPDCSIIYEATYTTEHQNQGMTKADIRNFLANQFGLKFGSIIPAFDPPGATIMYAPDRSQEISMTFLGEDVSDLFGSSLFYPLLYFITKQHAERVCYIGLSHFSIAPNGDIYPCQLFIGEDRFALGNVTQTGWDRRYNEGLELLAGFDKTKAKHCMACWAKYLCKDCPGQVFRETGKLEMPPQRCENIRKFLDVMLLQLAAIRTDASRWDHFCKRIESLKEFVPEVDSYA